MIQLASAVLLAGAMTAAALARDPFTVRGIEIDARADTAFEAQRAALEDGQTRAAQILLERLTLPEDLMSADFQPLTPEQAAALIGGLQIANEQRSATRYRGELTLDFDPREVRAFLTGLGVPFVESQAQPIGVIAVTEQPDGQRSLGGDWAQAWRNGGFQDALTPVIAAPQDAIALDQVLALDEGALLGLMNDLGVDALMIAVARQGADAVRAGGVLVRRATETNMPANDTGLALPTPSAPPAGSGLTREPIASVAVMGGYRAAAVRLVEQRQDAWKRDNVVRDTVRAELGVSILFDTLAEWRALQRAVAGASLIENARLDALSRTGAAMTLTHRGTREQVMAELNARGAVLAEDEALGWTVRSR